MKKFSAVLASVSLGLGGVGLLSLPAQAVDVKFCGTEDFSHFHYSTVNPHYDQMVFDSHFNLEDKHYHEWENETEGGYELVTC